jgi:hypothetical protein
MKTISTTEMPVFHFEDGPEIQSQKTNAQSAKIGWLHAEVDGPDSVFDIVYIV